MTYSWERRKTAVLIKLLEKHQCLWKTDHSDYFNKKKRLEAMMSMHHAIAKHDPTITEKDVKNKIFILRSQLRKEMRLIAKSEQLNGKNARQSKMWCLKDLSFLIPYLRMGKNLNKCYDPLNEYAVTFEESATMEQLKDNDDDMMLEENSSNFESDNLTTAEICKDQKYSLQPENETDQNNISPTITAHHDNIDVNDVEQSPPVSTAQTTKQIAETRYYNEMAELANAKRALVELKCKKLKLELRELLRIERSLK